MNILIICAVIVAVCYVVWTVNILVVLKQNLEKWPLEKEWYKIKIRYEGAVLGHYKSEDESEYRRLKAKRAAFEEKFIVWDRQQDWDDKYASAEKKIKLFGAACGKGE